ncbi:hypothetical protein IVB22_20050 [Bradyrhizobium sp. 190]|uniref:hypothetical protein n=1 Tax=Bradyrhizobium sp. 190 TaxID=2782658 RepID=UPI001FF83597|nr:hypothetical protein [Bradyrhizobium sp. 190]MCK1514813.1 hypothetical protein [Bradyrhizobium sp. 190]
MRNLTMADGRLDAPCHRMKRLEFWLVFIDAEHMASDLLASDLHNARPYYQVFPISEIRWPHSPSVSLRAIGRPMPQSQFYDLGMFPAPRAAEQQAA